MCGFAGMGRGVGVASVNRMFSAVALDKRLFDYVKVNQGYT